MIDKLISRPPIEVLDKYFANHSPDSDFAAHARLLQCKWRRKNNYQMNAERKPKYGNFLDPIFAEKSKVNFLTDNIRKLVSTKIPEIKSRGGMIQKSRMWSNLLSSQPLCFNLFGELCYDLDLATHLFQKVINNKINKITKIDFEYSTKLGNPDHSAFDVYIEYLNQSEQKCFIGIEVKYQENLKEESKGKAKKIFNNHKQEYISLTNKSKVFKENAVHSLQKIPLFQIWRDHLLMFNMLEDYHDGLFMYLYPFSNTECHAGVRKYQNYLVNLNEEQSKFAPIDLNIFISTLNDLYKTQWSKDLIDRYIGLN